MALHIHLPIKRYFIDFSTCGLSKEMHENKNYTGSFVTLKVAYTETKADNFSLPDFKNNKLEMTT